MAFRSLFRVQLCQHQRGLIFRGKEFTSQRDTSVICPAWRQSALMCSSQSGTASSIPSVTVEATTATTITLNIVAGPGEADGYSIRVTSTSADFCPYEHTRNISFFQNGAYVINDVPPSLMYAIEVRSQLEEVIDIGTLEASSSPASDVSASTGLVPLDKFTVINSTDYSITLAWFSNTTSNLTVTKRVGGQETSENILAEMACSSPRILEIDLSDPGTVYIIAYNPASSVGFNYTSRTDPGVVNISIASVNKTDVETMWSLPTVGDVDRFLVTWTSTEDRRYLEPGKTRSIGPEVTRYVIENLLPSTNYWISVTTVLDSTDDFEEQESEEVSISALTLPPTGDDLYEYARNETAIEYIFATASTVDVEISPNDGWMQLFVPSDRLIITNLLPGQLYTGFLNTSSTLDIAFRLRPSAPEVTFNSTESNITLGLEPGHGVLDKYIITVQCTDNTQNDCDCQETYEALGGNNMFLVDDLRPSVRYNITVVASAGEDSTSLEVTLEVTTSSIPENRFTVLDQTADSVFLAWRAIGPVNITMARLMDRAYVLNNTFEYDGCFSSNTLKVDDLKPATIYRFSMSESVSILIRTDPPSVATCSVETASSSYTLIWTAPPTGRNDGYMVTVTDSQGDLVQEEMVAPGDDLEVVKIRVAPETELNFVVNTLLAANDMSNFPQQYGAIPCTRNASTASLDPGEVSPENVTADSIPFTVGNASATPGFEGYNFTVEPQGSVFDFDAIALTGALRNITPGELYNITSLILGTDIVFTIFERAKPLSPVGGTGPSATPTSIRLEWEAPIIGIFTFYRVTINPTIDTEQNFVEVNNLIPGTNYNVTIVSISGTGLYQQISDPMEFQVITDNLTAGELVFVDVTSTSMTALWGDTGAGSYFYIVYSINLIYNNESQIAAGSQGEPMLTVLTGVDPSMIYRFDIFGSSFDIIANESVRTNPETPQPPTLASLEPFSLSFEWSPTNTTFSAYRVYYTPSSFRRELVFTIPSTSENLMYSQECLRPNTEYIFEIETVLNASGAYGEQTSDAAQSISITTSPYDNNEPHITSGSNTSLMITWLDAALNGQQVCLKELCSTLRSDTPMCLPTNKTCPLFFSFEGLVPGRRYVVYVEYNDGTMEDVIFTQTKPNPPEFLNATTIRSDTIRVVLSPPRGEFDGYELSFSPSISDPVMLGPDTMEYVLDNLESNTMYTISVFAFTGSNGLRLDGEMVSATVTTNQAILVATNVMTDEIIVSWSSEMLNVNSFQDFRLTHSSMVSDFSTVPKNSMPSINEDYAHPITGLVPGDLVTIDLETVTTGGQAMLVDTIVQRTNPDAVSMFQGVTDSPTSIRLLWRAPSLGLYRGYLVTYSPADGDQSSPIELGRDEEELTITGLQFNQSYSVSIGSIMGRGGTFSESEPASAVVSTGMGETDEVNIRTLNSTSVSFTWWGTGVANYTIDLVPTISCGAESPVEQDVTSREATFSELTPGAGYTIQYEDGTALGGQDAEFIAVPDQVSNIQVKFINSSAVTFTWTAPSGCYDRIEISYAPDTCTNPSPIVLDRAEGNEYTLTPLQANEEYELSFVTLQMTARSEPYVASIRTTCPEKEKLNVGSVQADSISLTWGNTTDAAATGFTLVATPESSTPIVTELDLSMLEYTLVGLMSGVEYSIVLYVNGTSISDSVTQTTCPSEAQNVTVIFFTQTCLSFFWLPPTGNFDSYEIFVKNGNPPEIVFEQTVYPDDELNVLVENLDAGTLYTIGVVTIVNGIKGEPALATQRTIDNLVMTSAVPGDSQAVTVSWEEQEGAAFYNLVYIPDNGNTTTADLTNLTVQSVTIGGLTPGKRYVFVLSVHYMDGRRDLLAQTSYTLKPGTYRNDIIDKSSTYVIMNVLPVEGVYETVEISLNPSGRIFSGERAAAFWQPIFGLEPEVTYTLSTTLKTGDEETSQDPITFTTDPFENGTLGVDERTTDSLRLVWADISDADSYVIRLDDRILLTSQTSYVLTGLMPGTLYNPQLLVRRTGMSEFDDVDDSRFFPTRPEPVLFFEVKDISGNNVTFIWSGPSSNFDRYTLYVAPTSGLMQPPSGPNDTWPIPSNETEFMIQYDINKEFLATLYTVARDVPGQDSPADMFSEPSTLNVIIDPSEPGTIDVTELTSTSIAITWTEIAGITDYIVTLVRATNNTELFSEIIQATLMANFSGLVPGEEYIIKIGLQCASDVLTLRQFTLPLEPMCAVFTWVAEDSVTLQWARPDSQLFGYEIVYDDGSGPYNPINVFDRNSVNLERTITGLMDGPGVEVNITTLAGAGMSQTKSNPVTISPSSLGSAFNVTSVMTTSVEFGWYDLPDASEYDVCIQPATGNATCRNLTEKSTSFTDLFPGAPYTLSIGWDSACGVSLTFNTVPSSPANLSLGNITSCAGEVTWDIPQSDYDFFEVTYSPDHGFTSSPAYIYSMDVGENDTSLVFPFVGILPNTDYNVSVVTVSGALDVRSEPSYITFRTESPANGSVAVTALSADSIQVGWGNETQDYVYIRFNLDGENATTCENESLCAVGNSSEFYNITELLSGQKYVIFVDQGGVCETLQQYTRPLPPVDIDTAERDLTSLLITWSDPGNETMFDWYYVAYQRADEIGNITVVGYLDPNVTSVALEGLTPRTEYLINVSTVSGEGSSQAFSDGELYSTYTAEANETINVFEYNTTSMTFTWPNVTSDLAVSVSVLPEDGILDLHAGNRSASVTGLVPGRLYNITVSPFFTICQRTKPLPALNFSLCPDVAATYFSICVTFAPPAVGEYDAFDVFTMDDFTPVQMGRRRRRSPMSGHVGFDFVERLEGNETQTVIDNLIPNTEYVVHLETISGAGSMNEEFSVPPEAIGRTLMIGETDLVFTDVNSTHFRVWWNRITNFTGNYTVTAQPGNLQRVVANDVSPYADFEDVSSSTVYEVSVETPLAPAATGSVRTDPDSVTNPALTAYDAITLIASWDSPDVVTDFNEILLALWTNGTEVRSANVSGNDTEFTFECLTPDTEYTVQMTSILRENGSFVEQYTNEEPLTATNSTVDLHPANETTPTIQDSSITSTSISVRWGRLGQAGYSVCLVKYCRQLLDDPVCLSNGSGLCSIEAEFGSLDPGQLYVVSYVDPNGVAKELEKVRTKPSAPSSVTITAVSSRLITIRWSPPPNIAEMVLEFFKTDFGDPPTERKIDNDGEYDIHGLDASTRYTVRLSSVGRPGAGDGSDDERLSGEPLQRIVSTSARILSVVNTPSALTFLWDEQPNPERFTGYVIMSDSISEAIPKQSEETSYQKSISNLTPGQLYTVSLFLQPIATFSEPLDMLLVRTAPSPPESLRIVDSTVTSLRVEWGMPVSGLWRGFEVDISPGTALQELPMIVGSEIRGFTFTGLLHNLQYTVSVTTIMGIEGLEERSTTVEEMGMTATGNGDEVYLLAVSSTTVLFGWTSAGSPNLKLDGNLVQIPGTTPNPYDLTALIPGRQYTVTVDDIDLIFTTVPESPEGLELERSRPYSLEWQVDTSLNNLNYERLQVSYTPESSQTTSPFDINRCTDGTFVLEGLQPDTEYSVSITAISGDTRSEVLTRYAFTTCAPEGQLHVVSLDSDAITVAWGPVENIQGYTLQLIRNGNIRNISPDADVDTGTFDTLDAATNYTLRLFVMRPSVAEETDTLEFVTDPSPPGPITLQSSTQTRLGFTWTASPSSFDQYELFISGGDMPEPRPVGVVSPMDDNEFEVGGLLPDTTYNIKIYTVFYGLRSVASEASFNTDEQILEFSVVANQDLTISWAEQDGAESYRLIYTTTNRDTNSIALVAVSMSLSINNTLAGAIYNFRLITIAVDGTENEVANADFVQSPLTPSAMISAIEGTTALLTFTPNEGIFDDYVVMLSSPTDSCGARQPVFTLPREACPELLLTDLYPNTMYTAQVFARTGESGFSLPSDTIFENFTTTDFVGNQLEIGEINSNSIEIIWQTGVVDEYLLHYSGPSGDVVSNIVPFMGLNYYTFSELVPGTQYSINVISLINRDDQGIDLGMMQYTKPDPIWNLVLTPQENTINLTWASPGTNHDGFLVCWYSANNSDQAWLDAGATSFPWVIPTSNEEYVVSVATYVGDRQGVYVLSNKVTNFITLTETSPLRLTTIAIDTITVSWVTIPGIVDYTLSYAPADGNQPASQDIDESSAITEGLNNIYYVNFTGLTPGREYTFTVVWPLAFNYSTDTIFTQPLPVYDPSVTNTSSCNLLFRWCLPDGDYDNVSITIEPPVSTYRVSYGNGTGGMCDYQTVYLDGLIPASAYNVSAQVVSGDQTSEVVTVYGATEDRGGAINVTEVTTTSLNFTWSEVPGEDVFRVEWTAIGGNIFNNTTVAGVRELSLTNLEPGEEFQITVLWDFLCELPTVQQFTKPLPVNNVTLVESTIISLTVTWEDPVAFGYNKFLVEYAPAGSASPVMSLDLIDDGINTATISGLEAGTLYEIAVYAVAGPDAIYERSAVTILTATTEQQNSEELLLQERASTSISVLWGNTTRPEVVGFVVRIINLQDEIAAVDSMAVGLEDDLSVTFIDLVPGSNYRIYLQVKIEGQDADSSVDFIEVTTLPAMPGMVNCTYTTQSLVRFEWSATQEGNLDGYEISTETNGEETPLESVGMNDQLQATADYLMAGTEYMVRVRSTLGDLRGEPAVAMCRTDNETIELGTAGVSTLFLDWNNHRGSPAYEVEYTPREGFPSSPVRLDNTTLTLRQLALNNLSPGTAYRFILFGFRSGSREEITGVTFVLAPLRVEQIIIVLQRPTSITIRIILPRRGRFRFLRLRIRRRSQALDAGPDGGEFLIPTDACPEFTFTNLLPGTDYAVDVNTVAEDGQTESIPSTMDIATPIMEEGQISLNEVTTTSISFSWGQVLDATSGPFDFYLLNLKDETSNGVQNVQVNVSEPREHIFSGLMPGKLYQVELIVNSIRQRSSATYTRPDPPTNIILSDLTTTSLTVDWMAPVTSYQGYRLCWSYNGTTSLELGPTVMQYMLSDLEPGAEYLVSLSAVVGTGTNQLASEKFNTIIRLLPPVELHVNVTDYNTTSISIAWGTDITLSDVGSYVISYWQTANNGSVQEVTVTDPSQTYYTIDGLVPGTEYGFLVDAEGTVQAVNPIGVVQYTNPETVAEIRIIPSFTYSVRLEWDRPAGNLSGYTFYYNVTQGTIVGAPRIDNIEINDTAWTVTYLLEGLEKDASSDIISLEVGVTTWAGSGDDRVASLDRVSKELDVNVVTITVLDRGQDFIQAEVNSSILSGLESITTGLYDDDTLTSDMTRNCTSMNCTSFTVDLDMLSSGTLYTIYAGVTQSNGREVVPLLAKAATIPESAVNPRFTSIGSDFVLLAWDNPDGMIDSYNVSYQPVNDASALVFTVVEADNTEPNELRVDGLEAGTNYSFSIVSVLEVQADLQEMGAPVEIFAVVGVQGSFNITAFDENTITIEWEQLNVNEYILFYDAEEGRSGNVTVPSTVPNMYTFINLTPGTEYTIGVQPGLFTVLEETQFTVPDPPTIFRFTSEAAKTVTVDWDPPAEGGAGTYSITYSPSDGEQASPLTVSSAGPVTFSDLTPLTDYNFTIVNINGLLESRPVTIMTTTSAQTLNLMIDPVDNTEFMVTWEDLDSVGFDQYCIRYEPYEARENRQQESFPVARSSLSARFYGLDPGQEYTVHVVTCTLTSQSTDHGSESIAYRLAPAPIAEILVTEGSLGPRAVTLEWSHPDGIRGMYEVTLDPADEGSVEGDALPVNITGEMTSVTIENLAAGKGYTVGITAISGDRRSEVSTFLVYTLPDPPQNLVLSEIEEETARVSWAPPAEENFAINEFVMMTTPETSTVILNRETNTTVLSGLVPGQTYTVGLASVIRPDGPNQPGVTGEPEVSSPFLMKPATPTGITWSNTDLTLVSVSWQPSQGVVTRYQYTYGPSGTSTPISGTTTPADTTVQLTGLVPSTLYEFRLWAESDRTIGVEMKTSDVVIVAISTTPNRPPVFVATGATATSITWTWSTLSSTITNYVISIKDDTGASIIMLNVQGLSHTEEDLNSFRTYSATLQAVFNNVPSDPISALPRTTLPSMPSEVLGLTITKTGIVDADVSWSEPELPNGIIANYTLTVYISLDDGTLSPFAAASTITAVDGQTDYSQSVVDLTPGQYYIFSVLATNQVATSNQRLSSRTLFAETAPPAPPPEATPALISRGSTIVITFSNLFDQSFGRTVRFAIIVKERVDGDTAVIIAKRQADTAELNWATARRTRPVPAYQTTPNDYNPFADGSGVATYRIGSESCDANDLTSYCNGALYAGTSYRFAIRAYGADGKFVDTEFSAPFRTDPDRGIFVIPAIVLAIIVVVILIVFMAMGFGCCGKPDGGMYSYGDNNGYSNGGYGNGIGIGNGNGHMKRALIDDGVNTYAYEQPQIMEHSFTNIPEYSMIPPNEGTAAQVHQPSTTQTRPIKKNMFADHVAKMSARNNAGYSDEYNSLPTVERTRAMTVARQDRNNDKNRYRNILPYDYTRVKLHGTAGNDYINANYIEDDHGNKKYIATQGPLPNTVSHFWEMVWESQSGTIVMMTALVEGGKTKCEHYWPASEEPQLHGNVKVTLIGSNQTESFIERTLLLEKEGADRTVTHYQYTAWTDHGVPASTAPLVGLLHQVRVTSQEDGSPSGPIVVHCSAGVGRTGTYIAADMLLDAVERSTATDYIDVAGTVTKLREQRALLVQTLYQYIYLHRTILTLIEEQ